ncbi:hypothetical protein [Bifidobacterium aquikefiri]|uniref:hypothetical protein n=1 Tax=Bifidobacterium aquikefiri TaxID=1653207 RepID=UPI0039E9F291
MSIATDEADELYPFNQKASSDDELLQNDDNGLKHEGYTAGRTAEPTEAEIKAAASVIAVEVGELGLSEELAKDALEAARRAVSE